MDLSHNSFGASGIVEISHALASNAKLLKLDIGFNRIGPSGAQVRPRPLAHRQHRPHAPPRTRRAAPPCVPSRPVSLWVGGGVRVRQRAAAGFCFRRRGSPAAGLLAPDVAALPSASAPLCCGADGVRRTRRERRRCESAAGGTAP
jgi:hypothetical protein